MNSRELALFVWIVILFFVVVAPSTQSLKAFPGVVRSFFAWRLTLVYLLIVGYIGIVTIMLSNLGLWTIEKVPSTVLWCILVGLPMIYSFSSASEEAYFKKGIISSLKLLVVFEFIVNLYVFSFWVEFMLVPVILATSLLLTVSEQSEKHSIVRTPLNVILLLVVTLFFVNSIIRILNDFAGFVSLDNMSSFTIPIIYSLSFLPFVYLLALHDSYLQLNNRIRYFCSDSELLPYIKWNTLKVIKLDIRMLKAWSSHVSGSVRFENKESFDRDIAQFAQEYKGQ